MKQCAIILVVLTTLFGCSSTIRPTTNQLNETQTAILTDYQLQDGFITIKAIGYGCTFFNSFEVAIAEGTSNAIEIIRTRKDNCGMKPRNVSLQYSFKHLGLDLDKQVKVINPLKLSLARIEMQN